MFTGDESDKNKLFLKEVYYLLTKATGREDVRSRMVEKIAEMDLDPEVSVAASLADVLKLVAERLGIPIHGASKPPAGGDLAESPVVVGPRRGNPCPPLPPRASRLEEKEKKRLAERGLSTFTIERASDGEGTAFLDGALLHLPCRMADLIALLGEYHPERPGEKSDLIPWKSVEALAKRMQIRRESRARAQGHEDKGKPYTAEDIWKQINCLRKHMDKAAINRFYVQTNVGRARLALRRPDPMDPPMQATVEPPAVKPPGGSARCGTP